ERPASGILNRSEPPEPAARRPYFCRTSVVVLSVSFACACLGFRERPRRGQAKAAEPPDQADLRKRENRAAMTSSNPSRRSVPAPERGLGIRPGPGVLGLARTE